MQIYKQTDLYEVFPFGKSKVQALIHSGEIPMIKVGHDYITTDIILEKWMEENVGKEIFYEFHH